MTYQFKPLVKGVFSGEIIYIEPFSFWGGVDINDGKIIQKSHSSNGMIIKSKILAVKNLIGSSSSSSVLLELIRKNLAPKAIFLENIDAISCMGSIIAEQIGLEPLPIYQGKNLKNLNGKTIEAKNDIIRFENQ